LAGCWDVYEGFVVCEVGHLFSFVWCVSMVAILLEVLFLSVILFWVLATVWLVFGWVGLWLDLGFDFIGLTVPLVVF
jgi:hypothetical protein